MIEFDGMSRPEITKILSISTEKNINPNNDTRIYWAKEVTFDYSTTAAGRVDFMRFKPTNNSVSGIEKGDFYCFEVKSSVNDFHSKNGHNFLGDFNYYVMPENVFNEVKGEIPYNVGVFVPKCKSHFGDWYDLKSVKNARRKDRTRPVSEMLLMMFRSAARERKTEQKKATLSEDGIAVQSFSNRLKQTIYDKGMTQRELATATGISEVSISRYINAERLPKITEFKKIAVTLGVTTDYLLE